jgi:transcriptional regulator with XRE-family HTH domain
MVNLSIFAERLNELMFDKKIAPEALSKVLGVDLSLIYKYLRKEFTPSTPNAIRIANYFNCSLDYLVGLSEDISLSFNVECNPFAICFQELLKKHNCTRYRLKKNTVLAKQSVDDWYNGVRVPTIDNLIVLAEYFNCSIDCIIGRDNSTSLK